MNKSQRSIAVVVVAVAAVVASSCGNPLFAPCTGTDCIEGLRCVDLGNQQRVCTKPCVVTKDRAGYPDGFEDDALFEDGGAATVTVADPQCGDAAVDITSQDNENEGGQNILVESEGAVGVCRVSVEQLEDDSISGDSQLAGFCAPL
ncbi:MAG: hypothetical protein Q8O67_26095 [Deltaproteobacteria bacterium]|nr:hypothetical protein [Deltaproteobacteria bacterium]